MKRDAMVPDRIHPPENSPLSKLAHFGFLTLPNFSMIAFTSAIEVWQGGVLALVLTGMGSDGMRGGKEIVAAGGSVIAQDVASSVVWGMPGAAAHAGICAAILPLNQIASKLVRVFAGDRS